MFDYESYLPFAAFNESSLFFKATEVFRYGFLLESIEDYCLFKQLYSYANYYVEIEYGDNFEQIKSIKAISIGDALDRYLNEDSYVNAMSELLG